MRCSIALFACLPVLLITGGAIADTLTVGPDGSWDYLVIQDAIDASANGDTILVYPGVYSNPSAYTLLDTKGKAITITSAKGPSQTTLTSVSSYAQAILCRGGETPATIISGFTVQNFTGAGGGSAVNIEDSSPTIINCRFISNRDLGAGRGPVLVSYGSPSFTDCSFVGNSIEGNYGGAVNVSNDVDDDDEVEFINCSFIGNEGVYGGAVSVFGTCRFIGSRFQNNAASAGGAIYISTEYSSVEIGSTLFCENQGGDISGKWADLGGNSFEPSCPCDGDVVRVPDDYPTIQSAIDANGSCDVIEVAPGTYYETLEFISFADVTLRPSEAGGTVTVDAAGLGRVMTMGGGGGTIRIEDFTITGGVANGDGLDGVGGGVYFSDQYYVTLERCTITANQAGYGGGACGYVGGQGSSIIDCVFSNNSASYAGGLYAILRDNPDQGEGGAVPQILNCTFESNTAADEGGGVIAGPYDLSAAAVIRDCLFSKNTAARGGGFSNSNSFPNPEAPLELNNCTFTGNTASDRGGAIDVCDENAVRIIDSLVQGNTANYYGGGICVNEDSWGDPYGGQVVAINTQFVANQATFGGGLWLGYSCEADLTDSLFLDNEAGYGGAVYASEPVEHVEILDTTFTGNTAFQGGALFGFETIWDISGSTFEENTAEQAGGAIYNFASVSEIGTSLFCSNSPDDIFGAWNDNGNVTFEDICGGVTFCVGDTNEDLNVDVLDLLYVILVWNTDNPLADFNGDGYVDVMDLLTVIANWNQCNKA